MLPRVRGWCRGSVAGANAVGAVFGVGQDVIKMCGESAEKLSERRELTVPVVLSICSDISARVCLRPARRPYAWQNYRVGIGAPVVSMLACSKLTKKMVCHGASRK